MATYVRPIPFKAIHPGVTLKEELEYRGIKQNKFAAAIGMQPSNLNDIIKGKRGISKDIAIRIAKELGTPAHFWLNLQHNYEEDLLRIAEQESKEQLAYQKESAWGELFVLKELYKSLRIIEHKAHQRVTHIIDILGFSPIDMPLAAGYYKRSAKPENHERDKAIRTWQLIVLLKAKSTASPIVKYTKGMENFAAAQIAELGRQGKCHLEQIRNILDHAGILLIEEPHLQHCPVDAFSTWWNGCPLIAVTKRYNDMDKLVFDILHELGHIHLHITENTTIGYIQVDGEYAPKNLQECQANEYAANHLIPPSTWQSILTPKEAIRNFNHHRIIEAIAQNAKFYGISPSIAVARYKKENNFYQSKRHKSPPIR